MAGRALWEARLRIVGGDGPWRGRARGARRAGDRGDGSGSCQAAGRVAFLWGAAGRGPGGLCARRAARVNVWTLAISDCCMQPHYYRGARSPGQPGQLSTPRYRVESKTRLEPSASCCFGPRRHHRPDRMSPPSTATCEQQSFCVRPTTSPAPPAISAAPSAAGPRCRSQSPAPASVPGYRAA
jgi:hypothetical protein